MAGALSGFYDPVSANSWQWPLLADPLSNRIHSREGRREPLGPYEGLCHPMQSTLIPTPVQGGCVAQKDANS
jgi:hypothetical protein